MMDSAPRVPHPGDVGRRVRQRREELGVSRSTLARRAGMAEEYLGYLEEQPASVAPDALNRLARGLQTSATALLGGNVDRAPGSGLASAHPRMQVLDDQECWRLLGHHGVGRLALVVAGDLAPLVVPLNFTAAGHDLLLRTGPGSAVGQAIAACGGECPASFEVDRIDDAQRGGWSVLVRGRASFDVPRPVGEALPQPWAGGSRTRTVRLRGHRVSGRRLDTDWTTAE